MEVKTLTTAAFQLGEPVLGLWYCAVNGKLNGKGAIVNGAGYTCAFPASASQTRARSWWAAADKKPPSSRTDFQRPWQKRSLPIRSDFPTYMSFLRGLQSPLIMTGRPIKMLHKRSVISVRGPASVLHIQYFHVNQHLVGSLLYINHPSRPVALKHKHVWNTKSQRRRKEIKTQPSSVRYFVSHGCTAARMSF